MRDLASKKGEEEPLVLVTTPSFCLSSLNSDDCGSYGDSILICFNAEYSACPFEQLIALGL